MMLSPRVDTASVSAGFRIENGHKPLSALGSLIIDLPSSESGPIDADLTVKVGDFHTLTKPVTLSANKQQLRWAIHTHLLPNDFVNVSVSVHRQGKIVWEQEQRFLVANNGALAESVRQSLRMKGTSVISDGLCDSSFYNYDDPTLYPWFNRPDAESHIDNMKQRGQLIDSEAVAMQQFVRDGFTILPETIDNSLLDDILACVKEAEEQGWGGYTPGSSLRLQHLHGKYEPIRKLWRHPTVIKFLTYIFNSAPRPCQTLTYIFGSQQRPHQDTIHLTPFPAGYMCGVWVALEDVQENSGELVVYPRTHRFTRLTMQNTGCQKIANNDWKEFDKLVADRWQSMIDESGVQPLYYRPKRGTILIWHENLMHGGSVRIDKSLTRRSIVSHYFADGAIAYYDSTGEAGYMEDPVRA